MQYCGRAGNEGIRPPAPFIFREQYCIYTLLCAVLFFVRWVYSKPWRDGFEAVRGKALLAGQQNNIAYNASNVAAEMA